MRRARLNERGWDRPIELESLPEPAAPTGKMVLLAVEACGVCHRDVIDRSGRVAFMQFPITPGHEVAGRVLAVGDEVTRWRVGDRVGTLHRDGCGDCAACARGETSLCPSAMFVLGILADGGYADRLLVPESGLYALPESLTAAQAAVYHCTFGTAWRGLGDVAAGTRVLVTGASGGVGAAAVLLAARLGCEVVAVLRDERNRALASSLGAAEIVVDRENAFHKQVRGIDVALECVGQPTFNAALRTLRLGGRLVAIGNVVDERVALNLGYIIVNALHVVGSSGATRADMAALFARLGTPLPEVPIAATLPLERAEEAQRRVRTGGAGGRIVLAP